MLPRHVQTGTGRPACSSNAMDLETAGWLTDSASAAARKLPARASVQNATSWLSVNGSRSSAPAAGFSGPAPARALPPCAPVECMQCL